MTLPFPASRGMSARRSGTLRPRTSLPSRYLVTSRGPLSCEAKHPSEQPGTGVSGRASTSHTLDLGGSQAASGFPARRQGLLV